MWVRIEDKNWFDMIEGSSLTPDGIEIQEWATELAGLWKQLRQRFPSYTKFRIVNVAHPDGNQTYVPAIEGWHN